MNLSIEQLMDGALATLRDEVLPNLESARARGRLYCVLDLLGNLRDRIGFRESMFLDETRSATEAIESFRVALIDRGLVSEARGVEAAVTATATAVSPQERTEAMRAIVTRCIRIAADAAVGDRALFAPLEKHLCDQAIRDVILLKPTQLNELSRG
jgi:hypothetical protein